MAIESAGALAPEIAPRSVDGERLCILTVHAHPDDESSKGVGTIAKAHEEGIHTVLVCCTGGELGDIANPAMDRPDVVEHLASVRAEELARATKLIGYDTVVQLGYRDSGMAGTDGNFDRRCFHQADLDEAAGRLVTVLRRERPQVVITYADNQMGYPHPDHLRVHDVSVLAFERCGDPGWYPWAGEPWTVRKLYYSIWARERLAALHDKHVELGIESPFDERWQNRPWEDHRITARVPVADFYDVRVNALLAHATQIDPDSPWWFGLPHDVARTIHPFDDYILARSDVEGVPAESGAVVPGSAAQPYEDDVFNGLRAPLRVPDGSVGEESST